MAIEFDTFTGSWIEQNDNPQAKQETTETAWKEKTEGDEKKSADEVIESHAKKLNKKAIIIIITSIGIVLCFFRLLDTDKTKEKKQEIGSASEIMIPDFGDYQNRTYKADSTENMVNDIHLNNEVTPYIPPVQKKTPNNDVQKYSTSPPQPYVSTAPRTDDIASRSADLAADIMWLNKNQTQEKDSTTRNLYPSGSSYSTMSSEEYLNSRLANIPLSSGLGNAAGESDSYTQQNMQQNKTDFYKTNTENFVSGSYIARDTIWMGTIIPAVLLTGINTDTPGLIKAQVTENVYDSMTGKMLLIPQGTILIADYNSYISYAQKRVQIAWNTLIRPDGYQLTLNNMSATDSQGFSGIKGHVDEHFFEYVKAMGIITAFTAVNGEFANAADTANNQYAQNLISANQSVTNQLGAKLIERAMDIQPTITVKNGSKINVFMSQNIALPPIENNPASYKR